MEYIYSARGFVEITNINDIVVVEDEDGTRKKGTVTLINRRGVNVKFEEGVTFYKWVNVKQVDKKQITIM